MSPSCWVATNVPGPHKKNDLGALMSGNGWEHGIVLGEPLPICCFVAKLLSRRKIVVLSLMCYLASNVASGSLLICCFVINLCYQFRKCTIRIRSSSNWSLVYSYLLVYPFHTLTKKKTSTDHFSGMNFTSMLQNRSIYSPHWMPNIFLLLLLASSQSHSNFIQVNESSHD